MAQKSFTVASSPDVDEVATEEADDDDWTWIEPFNQRARVFWHVADTGYDIEVIDTDGLTRVMSQVKLPTPNPSGLTVVDLIDGPAADLLRLVMNNLPSFIAMEPLLSFLKDTFCDASLGSSAGKLDLIDGDHDEGANP
jgi:hypothetical protein